MEETAPQPNLIDTGDSANCVDILRQHFGTNIPLSGVEVGAYRGQLSAKLLQAFPNLTLLLVDEWRVYEPYERYSLSNDACSMQTAEQQEANYNATLKAIGVYPHTCSVARASSREVATNQMRQLVDFVFIDADHSLEGAREDIKLWWPWVRTGGLLMGHDYQTSFFGVIQAVDEFVAREGLHLKTLGTCWWVEIPPPFVGEPIDD